MQSQTMDRGTDAMKAHLSSTTEMNVRQTRRGCLQEIFCCEARTEFKYFIGDSQVAQSLEDTNCCCRVFCAPCHPYTMVVKELNTDAELFSMDRPTSCPAGGCKCCCYQQMTVSSAGTELGRIKETCYYCVPSFKIFNDKDEELYLVHPPTCCGGCCMNCCTEGNPCCGRGCCKVPFWIFPADAAGNTNGSEAPKVGKIVKMPKSAMTEVFTDANAFEISFPENASVERKALLTGTSVFLNSIYFEGGQQN